MDIAVFINYIFLPPPNPLPCLPAGRFKQGGGRKEGE